MVMMVLIFITYLLLSMNEFKSVFHYLLYVPQAGDERRLGSRTAYAPVASQFNIFVKC